MGTRKIWERTEDGLIKFPRTLERAKIVKRPNRFIVEIEINGKVAKAHCPVTGSIGSMTLNGLDALVSRPLIQGSRATEFTLEAIQLPGSTEWIGVNQTQVNRYIEAGLFGGDFSKVTGLGRIDTLKSEPHFGGGRLDFLVNEHIYIEAKMPLKHLQIEIPDSVPHKPAQPTQVDRMVRQLEDITVDLRANPKSRALFFTVFCYDNPGFQVPKGHDTPHYKKIQKVFADAKAAGLEQWQVNFEIQPEHVRVAKVFRLE